MTKDFIKFLALNEVKRSIADWNDIRESYVKFLEKETDPTAKDKWIALIQEAEHYIMKNTELLKEVDGYEF